MPAARKPAATTAAPSGPPTIRPPEPHGGDGDPTLDALVRELIGRVADRWTMILLELLAEHGTLRSGRLAALSGGISQKMLTQTLRQMERDGLLTRTVHATVPPKVEYRLTDLGASLGAAFCGVWEWAAANRARVEAARAEFDARPPG